MGFPGGSDGKESACRSGDSGLTPGLGRSPEGGNGNPLQYSCLGHPMARGAWQVTVRGVTRVAHDLVDKTTTWLSKRRCVPVSREISPGILADA